MKRIILSLLTFPVDCFLSYGPFEAASIEENGEAYGDGSLGVFLSIFFNDAEFPPFLVTVTGVVLSFSLNGVGETDCW